jgi:hypothetical protein
MTSAEVDRSSFDRNGDWSDEIMVVRNKYGDAKLSIAGAVTTSLVFGKHLSNGYQQFEQVASWLILRCHVFHSRP